MLFPPFSTFYHTKSRTGFLHNMADNNIFYNRKLQL
ncbi:hypothetical protein RUMGNA_03942 [Mediterraneibacter gnavus ATCC 29149]|uniref:Uncharacterized protein n=1 Tax=Mediterraneibacter gnavus (strain ATCC 29149 / DSM 114966 / JCM 6515 / VPI C7-9) TaxID=411470 RepID=A7B8L8_MEDG7|nr:hypothetical protein RUMGNA_03942 [Mediterraneibacter gnavus ATCC 29149]